MKKLLLIIGPESTGTRIFTKIFSQHSLILGTSNADKHSDILDDVWRELEKNAIKNARQIFPNYKNKNFECILTRRSMPHGCKVGKPASFMDFPNIKGLYQLSLQMKLNLVVLITIRSPVANLSSWTTTRASPKGSFEKAQSQYYRAYNYLFEFLNKSKVSFFFLSIEALLLDNQDYVQSIFHLLELPSQHIDLELRHQVNQHHYMWYSNYKNNIKS